MAKKKGESKSMVRPKLSDALNKKLKDIQYNKEDDTLNFHFEDIIISVKMIGDQLLINTKKKENDV